MNQSSEFLPGDVVQNTTSSLHDSERPDEKLTTYRVVGRSELTDAHYAAAPGMIDADDPWGDHTYDSYVFRYEGDQPAECLGSDGGEPEDQTLSRDWSWVAPALNDAYARGRSAS